MNVLWKRTKIESRAMKKDFFFWLWSELTDIVRTHKHYVELFLEGGESGFHYFSEMSCCTFGLLRKTGYSNPCWIHTLKEVTQELSASAVPSSK